MKTYSITIYLPFLIIFMMITSCTQNLKKQNGITMKPAKVELHEQNGKYELTVDGEPFYVRGAGLEFGIIESLAKHGGNSFRTWRVENGQVSGLEVLNEAHKNGLMVCMGLEVARERHGFDYDDDQAVKEQLETIKKDIIALKDHPALLMWGIGNELNLHSENPKVWNAVNEIAVMIKDIRPKPSGDNHAGRCRQNRTGSYRRALPRS